MIQGGDPRAPAWAARAGTSRVRFLQNGVANPIKHTRGVISMARSMDPELRQRSSSSCPGRPALDGSYAAFGHMW